LKSMRIANNTDTTYIPIEVKTASDGYKAHLHLMLNHFANVNHLMLKIVSEKYKIPFEEMLMTVSEDAEFQETLENPVINSLCLVTQEDANKVIEKEIKTAPVQLKRRKPKATVAK
jgi:hypothetical protein